MAPAVNSSSLVSSQTKKPANAGTALHRKGLAPPAVEDFGTQDARAYQQLKKKGTDLEKYIFLSWLRNTNLDMFYRLVLGHLKEIAPIIYTPTVGQACQEFSNIYPFLAPPNAVDGLYIPLTEVDHIDEIIQNYKRTIPAGCEPDITVITDGSRILGLGDLGINGMGIPVGKLQLYVAAGGLDPTRCLPIVLDFGTDNSKFLEDPLYLGIRQKRPQDAEFYAATEKVLKSLTKAFPSLFIQFEDFNTPHAFGLLEQWRNQILCFNDDIQGTGSVVLSAFISAIRQAGIPAKDQRILFVGAGSAGVGVAKQLVDYLEIEHKIPEEQAKAMFWFVDSRGMITANRGDTLAEHKVYFARQDNGATQCKSLEETLEYVRPTALIGLSTIYKAFNEKILTRLNEMNSTARPIVFPLSNPMTKAECTFEEAMRYTNNRVLFASGTAFPEYTVPGTEIPVEPVQANNCWVFPPIGLGAVLSKPKCITDTMIFAVSKALANSLNEQEKANGELLPRIERIREVSAEVAAAFIHQAVREGLARDDKWIALVNQSDSPLGPDALPDGVFSQNVLAEVKKSIWAPAQSVRQLVQNKL
ncbi:malic enzyme [Coemansia reversa NRRL 1564]|uniref:Malic enzyme n=1 Tax=Coemansia reversa (strain ATCC 12441 / NRRL 1564) TaxID=763665 RepID=A0A2G5BF23_COERN|nr:malic enzyme [Coemansia reversa NRRL 1564]|eukprot:PIA17604.1 malic enzyme [Coemansia reversa NRRL 1564]